MAWVRSRLSWVRIGAFFELFWGCLQLVECYIETDPMDLQTTLQFKDYFGRVLFEKDLEASLDSCNIASELPLAVGTFIYLVQTEGPDIVDIEIIRKVRSSNATLLLLTYLERSADALFFPNSKHSTLKDSLPTTTSYCPSGDKEQSSSGA